jgi:DNA-binding MarR family transcriptional regulator
MARIPESQLGAWRAVLNSHASLVAHVERALSRADLPPLGWYDLLWAIRRSPGKRIRMAELADNLTLTRGGVTKLTDRLEGAGLLQRTPAEDDRRGLFAEITPAGEALLRKMWPVYAGALNETFGSAVSDREAKVIAAALQRATASIPSA